MIMAPGLEMINFMIFMAVLLELFWVWMLVDCAITRALDLHEKMIWMAVMILTQGFGAVAYALVVKWSRRSAPKA